MKGKNFESELPAGYAEAKVIDAKSGKFVLIMNLIALVIMIGCLVPAYFALGKPRSDELTLGSVGANVGALFALIAVFVGYIILHELVHGAAYKYFTRQKLTFGITLTCAFCGVPTIYVYRRPALVAVLAPFVVFLPLFLAACFLLPSPLLKLYAVFMLAMHLGGCSGDLWVSALLLFKYRDNRTLINDTGPKQTFYVPAADACLIL